MPDSVEPVLTPSHRLRRQLLKGMLGTILGAVVAFFGWTKVLFPKSPPEKQAKLLSLGNTSDYAPNKPPSFVTPQGADETYIVENEGNSFRVLSAKCTHQGCTVGWDAKKEQFLCPCHAARFDRAGQVINGPAQRPLATMQADVRDGKLFIAS